MRTPRHQVRGTRFQRFDRRLARWSHDQMKVAGVKAMQEPALGSARRRGLFADSPFASQSPSVQPQTPGCRIERRRSRATPPGDANVSARSYPRRIQKAPRNDRSAPREPPSHTSVQGAEHGIPKCKPLAIHSLRVGAVPPVPFLHRGSGIVSCLSVSSRTTTASSRAASVSLAFSLTR